MNLRLGRGLTAIVETPRLGCAKMSAFPNVRNEASSAVDRAHPLGQLRVPPHVTSFFCGLSLPSSRMSSPLCLSKNLQVCHLL